MVRQSNQAMTAPILPAAIETWNIPTLPPDRKWNLSMPLPIFSFSRTVPTSRSHRELVGNRYNLPAIGHRFIGVSLGKGAFRQ
jgi:hypothetical protein